MLAYFVLFVCWHLVWVNESDESLFAGGISKCFSVTFGNATNLMRFFHHSETLNNFEKNNNLCFKQITQRLLLDQNGIKIQMIKMIFAVRPLLITEFTELNKH